jgi:AmmeMemoRadiSam system protein B
MTLRPSISGSWYPSDPVELAKLLDGLLEQASGSAGAPRGMLRGLLVPHAGYAYSGGVAAYAYAGLRETPRSIVVILGPFHAYHEAPFLVSQYEAYQTPLGPVPIDRDLTDRIHETLVERSGMDLTPTADAIEHSIEIQLPFLQTVLEPFRLVPIMLAQQTPAAVTALAGALAEALHGSDVLLIASSDLSHFNPQHMAALLDQEMLRRITSMQPDAVLGADAEGAGSACGVGAIATMLMTARAFGAEHSKLLRYLTSGDVTGNVGSVIGYAAAAFW